VKFVSERGSASDLKDIVFVFLFLLLFLFFCFFFFLRGSFRERSLEIAFFRDSYDRLQKAAAAAATRARGAIFLFLRSDSPIPSVKLQFPFLVHYHPGAPHHKGCLRADKLCQLR
jgi:hypothetical protein